MDELRPGDKVINSEGTIGRVARSKFGLSVLFTITDEGGQRIHGQTLGEPSEVVSQYWTKINETEENA